MLGQLLPHCDTPLQQLKANILEEEVAKLCRKEWTPPMRTVPEGFLQGAGEVKVALSCARESCCICRVCSRGCLAAAGGTLDADKGEAFHVDVVPATLASGGDAMGFWSGDLVESKPQTLAPLHALGCEEDIGLHALHHLAQAHKLCYSAHLRTTKQSCDGAASHLVTFSVHLSLCWFNSRQASRDSDNQLLLRRLLSRFTAHPTSSSVEQHEIVSMRKAAQSLGLDTLENAAMNAFLDPPLPLLHAQSFSSKFRLDRVLQSILQPSCSAPQPCSTEVAAPSPPAGAALLPQPDPQDPKGKRAASPPQLALPARSCGVCAGGGGSRSGGGERHCSLCRRMPCTARVHFLPDDTLVNLLNFLEPRQLDVVSVVCRTMHAAARLCVPGTQFTCCTQFT